MILVNDAKNINNAYVVVKRYNGSTYFHGRYARDLTVPSTAALYFEKEKAEAVVTNLNATRKKCKYFIESASKHFVNGWRLNMDWYNNTIKIENPPLPIQEITEKRRTVTFPSEFKSKLIETLQQALKEKEASVQNILKRYETDMAAIQKTKNDLAKLTENVAATNFEDMLQPYATGAEQTLRILYEVKK